jgi:hypothetical protein
VNSGKWSRDSEGNTFHKDLFGRLHNEIYPAVITNIRKYFFFHGQQLMLEGPSVSSWKDKEHLKSN